MNYISLNIAFSDAMQAEILTAELADYPFESFEADAGTLKAYIPQEQLADCKGEVDALLARYGVQGRYIAIETQNWNAVWESNFPPVDVEGRLLIRAPFHEPAPAGVMEVVVMPKMSFGTGHHATTWLVSRAVLDLGVAGRRGLDMGSGTGVLSIVAAKCGAAHVDAVDIDDWADANCRENIASNGVADRIEPMLGDVRRIAGRHYGFILANINRNILTADMPAYAAALEPGGDLVMSGFLEQDVPAIVACGVVLHTLKYGDSSMVVYLLTDTGGRRSYMVQGVRSRNGRGSKLALFQPMFPVEFEGLESSRQQMHRFKEVQGGFVLQSLPFDEGVANFHLWFLANLSRFLGFCPGNDYSADDWFDIREGLYTKTRPQHVSFMTQECTRILRDMMECDVRCLAEIGLNRTQRVEFLNAVLVYFGYHLDAISAVQSVRILREVF